MMDQHEPEALTDADLQTAFENCTLSRSAWTHRSHVRMAFLYASREPFSLALGRMRQAIKAYNAAQRTPESLESGYHETMTVAFMRLVHARISQTPGLPTSDSFCTRHPELLDKTILRRFYSRDRIVSAEAKIQFVEPDLAELPPE